MKKRTGYSQNAESKFEGVSHTDRCQAASQAASSASAHTKEIGGLKNVLAEMEARLEDHDERLTQQEETLMLQNMPVVLPVASSQKVIRYDGKTVNSQKS